MDSTTSVNEPGNKPEPSAWWNPDLSPEEFRRLGYRVVDMIADYYDSIDYRPVYPPHSSAEAAAPPDGPEVPIPEEGQDPDAILDEWTAEVLPNATHVGSARFFGFVMGSGTMMGTLAEALTAAVNMNAGGWKGGPAATQIERQTISWIAELVGYSASCGGLLTSGGTMANFTALLTALRNRAPYDTTRGGLQSHERRGRFLLYMADHEGHVSIERTADMLNLGRNAVRRVPSRSDFTMDPAALESMIRSDIEAGDSPFCVVAQVGAINTGAIDPLEDIAEICAAHSLWFHADGACGAFGRLLPDKAPQYSGLERADSVTLDPHKWLFIPYECGCVLVSDPEKLRRAFSMTAPYLRGRVSTEENKPGGETEFDYFENGPQMSRGFRALKVWMTLKHYGVAGYRKLLGQSVRCAERLDELVRSSPDFEPLHEPNLFIYSFRYVPARYRTLAAARAAADPAATTDSHSAVDDAGTIGPDDATGPVDEYLDRLNQRIADEIRAGGFAFVMTSIVNGRRVLRLSICSHRTTLGDIEAVFARLREIGAALDRQPHTG